MLDHQITLAILEKLIAFNTVSANSNLEAVDYIEVYLRERNFQITRIENAAGNKAGLYAETSSDEGGVLLSAHTDVVPVTNQNWSRDPFTLYTKNDRLYGRGTTDMKGFAACMLSLADTVSKIELTEPLKLVFSYDEEVGCTGIKEMMPRLKTLLKSPRACIVGEPTEMQVATGHKGKIGLRARCKGQAGHSALAPNYVNAVHIASEFIQRLIGLQQRLAEEGAQDSAYTIPYSTLHVGPIAGGTALNIVPHEVELLLECRYLAALKSEELMALIEDEARQSVAKFQRHWEKTAIEFESIMAYPGHEIDTTAEITRWVNRLSGNNKTIKVSYGTEAGYFAQAGIPTIVCGPGSMDGQGHKADEYIAIAQLKACEDMMGALLKAISPAH